MWLEISEIFRSKSYWKFLIERIFSSYIWMISMIIIFSVTILWIISNFTDNLIWKNLAIIIIILLVLSYGLYKKYFISRFNRRKIGILLAIDDKWEFPWRKIKSDLLHELNKNLDTEKFQIISAPNHWAKKLQSNYKNKEKISKYHDKIWWIYRIVWSTEKENDWWYKCFIESNALVFHIEIPAIVQKELWMDFSRMYLKEIKFDDNYYKSWIKFSWKFNWIVAQYIIWVACLISWDPLNAWNLHKHLYDELRNISKVNDVNQKIDEWYFKLISEKIRIIQYNELWCITEYYYQWWNNNERIKWLLTRKSLSEQYWLSDAWLLNNRAIYEFIVNKDIKQSRKLIKEAWNLWHKWHRYSLVFLDLWDKNYKKAKDNMKRIIKKKHSNSIVVNSVIKFIDDVLITNENRFEFLYREALIYYKQEFNLPLAFQKLEKYISIVWNNNYEYELYNPKMLLKEIEKQMKIA